MLSSTVTPNAPCASRQLEARRCPQGYYDDKTKNRKLQWIYSLGHVTIKFATDTGTYDLMCSSTFHAAVLLQFNEGELPSVICLRRIAMPPGATSCC